MISQDFRYTESAIRSYISDLVADLKFPMTNNLLAARLVEMEKWYGLLRKLDAIDQPEQVTA